MRAMLKERGLADTFSGLALEEMPLMELPGRGPDNKAGCILGYQTPSGDVPRRLGFYPKEQSWTPVGDGSLVYIGVDTAEPPKAFELARKEQYPGYVIPIGETGEWIVPVIRRPDGTTELPRGFVRNVAGVQEQVIKAAYRRYWDDSAGAAEWFFGTNEQFRADKAVELAVQALSINYRFGWNEQNLLQPVDSETYLKIVAATVDMPAVQERLAAKKKGSGTSHPQSFTLGSTEESLATDQAEATSI